MEASVNMTKDTLSTLILIKQKRSAMSQQENKPFQWDEIKVRKFAASHLGYPTSTYSASFDRALHEGRV